MPRVHVPAGLRFAGTSSCLLSLFCSLVAAQTPFTEEAIPRGINYPTTGLFPYGHGVALVDLDDDGDPDVIIVGQHDGVIGLYENLGDGTFDNRSFDSGVPRLPQASGVIVGDYDGDGDLDLFVSALGAPDLLLRSNGRFDFSNATLSAGLGDDGLGHGPAWGDFDGDGWLDLFVANYTEGLNNPSRLYRNLADGTFDEVLQERGVVDFGMTFQGVLFDYDRDGDADLYVSNDRCGVGQSNRLWQNQNGTFVDVTDASGAGACIFSMGVAVGDFDGNLTQDIYVTNLPDGNPLYLNAGDGTFVESSVLAGVASFATGWGAVFFDFDNDGYQELYVCNEFGPNRLYDHDGSWPASDLAAGLGVAETVRNSYGVAVGDIDLDGDQDLLVSNAADRVRLFINHTGQAKRWVRLQVAGHGANRFGIGTIVEIRTGTHRQMREVIAGSNYKSQNELTLHFGLDVATVVDEVRINWPQGSTRTLINLPADATWTLYPPEALGDGDLDGDLDPRDFFVFFGCYNAGTFASGCEMMDLDGDADVDDADHAAFMAIYDGPVHDCNANGIPDLQEIFALIAIDTDNGVPDACEESGAPAGTLQNGDDLPGTPLTIGKAEDGMIRLSWGGSCLAGDGDYTIYQGDLGNFTSHTAKVCSTLGALTRTLLPADGDSYYLVVPNNGAREGGYGNGAAGARSPGLFTCLNQAVSSCL